YTYVPAPSGMSAAQVSLSICRSGVAAVLQPLKLPATATRDAPDATRVNRTVLTAERTTFTGCCIRAARLTPPFVTMNTTTATSAMAARDIAAATRREPRRPDGPNAGSRCTAAMTRASNALESTTIGARSRATNRCSAASRSSASSMSSAICHLLQRSTQKLPCPAHAHLQCLHTSARQHGDLIVAQVLDVLEKERFTMHRIQSHQSLLDALRRFNGRVHPLGLGILRPLIHIHARRNKHCLAPCPSRTGGAAPIGENAKDPSSEA